MFLRKQLVCDIERQVRRRRTNDALRIALVFLSRLVEWRDLLTIVRPETFVRWHRDLYRLFPTTTGNDPSLPNDDGHVRFPDARTESEVQVKSWDGLQQLARGLPDAYNLTRFQCV